PHAEKLAPANLQGMARWPLLHQMRTYQALKDTPVVMNTYNTGTGKTLASLLHLFDLQGTGKNVLFIAPTNALLEQHAEDIEQFIQENGLDFKVLRVTAAYVRQLDDSGQRRGMILHKLLSNYLAYEPDEVRRKPIILVVNPDIFYYAIFARYHQHDQRNLMEDFILRFDYVVIDEFHYYDSKQLANFLFVLALFDQFGYFDVSDRRVCLLSATPLPYVSEYLDRLFGDRWRMISPKNEDSEDDGLETIPSLAPLEVTLLEGSIEEWVKAEQQTLRQWLDAGEDGAIISSSLWRINQSWHLLRPLLGEEQMGRITGPEPAEARQTATARSLILASPTVDIGYNFVKKNKERQNIDFLVCDARYRDGLLQRIGRAGRVLGKQETDRASHAVALLPPEAVADLKDLDGRTLTREQFNEAINQCPCLPAKHDITSYINTYAIIENFYPIFKLGSIMPPALHNELEALYERVRDVFAPHSKHTYRGLKSFYFKYQFREQWLRDARKNGVPMNTRTAEHVADWLVWLDPESGHIVPSDLVEYLPGLLGDEEQSQGVIAFVQSQVALMAAYFNFRDSFQSPTAAIYDPQHLLSSEDVNTYDLFHLFTHFDLTPQTRGQWKDVAQVQHTPKTDFFYRIRGWREEKLVMRFAYDAQEEEQHTFMQRWCDIPVGISGLKIRAGLRGQGILAGALPPDVADAIAEQTIVSLIIPPARAGIAISRLKGTSIWSHPLTVHFPDSTVDEGYRSFFGKAAFMAHAELAPALHAHQARTARAPIIL
ncbi:MAG: type I-D CRISPR-associated helicase Cas3', partial [Chloroflexi bacterium]|nr:type I-D CRISPR-associated helicase Cas3' [Chloroflexota bacterium]